MNKEEIVMEGLFIEIIRKRNMKNLYIRVKEKGMVTVSAPAKWKDEDIKRLIFKNLSKIRKMRDRILDVERERSKEYISGEYHYLWGKPYQLQVNERGRKCKIEKTPTNIFFTVKEGATRKEKEKVFVEWYRQELKKVLPTMVQECEKKTGISANEFRIKNMKTRWGTCNVHEGRIWINLQLAKKPMDCLEYVLIHELVHLLEKNHTSRFYRLVEDFYPTWKETKKRLDRTP